MDKYSKHLIRVLLIPSVLLLFSLLASTVNAQQNTWSFDQHPHPSSSELSDVETKLISDAYEIKPITVLCESVVNGYFQIYQNHYPDYVRDEYSEEKFQNWMVHFVTPESPGPTSCFYYVATRELVPYMEQSMAADFLYCGTYSRQPMNQREHDFVKINDAYMTLVDASVFSAAAHLLVFNNITEFVHLNPDVVYFFSLLIEPHIDSDERIPEIINLFPDLSDGRKDFVERAAQNLDLQSVLATTAPCAPAI